jgi:hypothetical protein
MANSKPEGTFARLMASVAPLERQEPKQTAKPQAPVHPIPKPAIAKRRAPTRKTHAHPSGCPCPRGSTL